MLCPFQTRLRSYCIIEYPTTFYYTPLRPRRCYTTRSLTLVRLNILLRNNKLTATCKKNDSAKYQIVVGYTHTKIMLNCGQCATITNGMYFHVSAMLVLLTSYHVLLRENHVNAVVTSYVRLSIPSTFFKYTLTLLLRIS